MLPASFKRKENGYERYNFNKTNGPDKANKISRREKYGDSDRAAGGGHGEIQYEGGIRGFGRKQERICGVCSERLDKVRRATDSERPHGQAEEILYRPGDKDAVEDIVASPTPPRRGEE